MCTLCYIQCTYINFFNGNLFFNSNFFPDAVLIWYHTPHTHTHSTHHTQHTHTHTTHTSYHTCCTPCALHTTHTLHTTLPAHTPAHTLIIFCRLTADLTDLSLLWFQSHTIAQSQGILHLPDTQRDQGTSFKCAQWGAEKMAQVIRCLPHKHEVLSSVPKNLCWS